MLFDVVAYTNFPTLWINGANRMTSGQLVRVPTGRNRDETVALKRIRQKSTGVLGGAPSIP